MPGHSRPGTDADAAGGARPPRLVATDFFGLCKPSECRLRVWLRHQGEDEAPPGPYMEVLKQLGIDHERNCLAELPDPVDLGPLSYAERFERTRELVEAGDRVIYQGALRAETTLAGTPVEIVGYPDFPRTRNGMVCLGAVRFLAHAQR